MTDIGRYRQERAKMVAIEASNENNYIGFRRSGLMEFLIAVERCTLERGGLSLGENVFNVALNYSYVTLSTTSPGSR